MSSNEGSLEEGGGGGIKPEAPGGRDGSVGASMGGAQAITAARGVAPVVATGSADLMLYTACEEGFVKTWRVGERAMKGVLAPGAKKKRCMLDDIVLIIRL